MADPIPEFLLLLKALPRDWRAVIDRRLAPLSLSQAKWQPLLFLLRAESPPTQAEIARHLDIESPTLVRLLDRLADDGWIERKNCAGDRRARRIHLTARAKAVGAEIEGVVGDVRRQLMHKVTAAELRECTELLRRIHDNALRMLDETPLPEAPKPVARRRKRDA